MHAEAFGSASIAPLMADQSPIKAQKITTLPSGERVILDPGITVQRILLLYYQLVNGESIS